ncbi:MAG: hypothetical protein ACLQPV_08615 [Vulcanimicrobiaceae bacterium]
MTARLYRLCFAAGAALLAAGCAGAGTGSVSPQTNGPATQSYVPATSAALSTGGSAAIAPLAEPLIGLGKPAVTPNLSGPIINDSGSYTNGQIILGANTAATGYGIEGITDGQGAGVYGHAASTSSGSNGVYGFSSAGNGVYGYASTTGNGVYGAATNGAGVRGGSVSGDAVEAIGSAGAGLYASSNGYFAVDAEGGSGSPGGALIRGQSYGVYGAINGSSGFPILAQAGSNIVFYVDQAGNMWTKGVVKTFVATTGGRQASAYGTKSTSPTIEDDGSGQLVNGTARVPLDATFAQAIDPGKTYHVMLTPDGDTRGLYVESKSPAGFVVREVQGGRSSIAFDYHIYATQLGHANQRMGLVDAAAIPRPATRSAVAP